MSLREQLQFAAGVVPIALFWFMGILVARLTIHLTNDQHLAWATGLTFVSLVFGMLNTTASDLIIGFGQLFWPQSKWTR